MLARYIIQIPQFKGDRVKRCVYIIAVLLCIMPFSGKATSFPPFSFLDIEQGLSNNTVRTIFQDHNGFIWLGTFDGLNRYDGYDSKVFRNKPNDTGSLVHNIILSITEDSAYRIWIGTRQGVSRLDPLLGRFTTIRLKTGQRVFQDVIKDIRTDKYNNAYIASEGSGLLLCPNGSTLAQSIPLFKGNEVITQYGVKALRVDKLGQVWALVPKYGLARYRPGSDRLELVIDKLVEAAWLEINNDGHLLLASGTMLYDYNMANNSVTGIFDYKAQQPDAGSIVSFGLDQDGRCWIGTVQARLLAWKPGEPLLVNPANENSAASLSAVGLHTLYIDRQSRKWIGTSRGGAAILDPRKGFFHTLLHEPGNANSLPTNVVSSLYEAADGRIYLGTDGGGLTIWDRSANTFHSFRNDPANPLSLSDNTVINLNADKTGRIWITTFRQGVNRYNPATGRIERFMPVNTFANRPDRVTYGLLVDRQSQVWVSTLRQNSIFGALYRFDEGNNRFEIFDDKLSDMFTLFEDRAGNMWGGNLSKLVKIDRAEKKHTYYDIGYAVRCVYEDRQGRCWLGTEGGGLLLFDRQKGKITYRYTINEGLGSDVVLTILEGGNGELWLSTFNGLARFNPEKRSFKNFYQGDGLQSNQFYYNSALAMRSGELAFGGIKGLNIFNPASIRTDHNMPALRLTGLLVNNTPVEADTDYIKQRSADAVTAITVPYSEAVLGFRFTALEYTVPGKISYAYYMEGWDRGWNNTGNIRTATYTHLAEGNYTFRVKCTNGEGEWSTQELAIQITVLPPWYRSWWAFSLYAAAMLAAVWFFISYKVRQSRLYYEVKVAQLQARETQVKAQQEKEVNEKRLTFFTHLSHEFRTPLTLIIDPVREMLGGDNDHPQKKGLQMVYRNARRLLSLVDQLLLFRKAETQADNLRLTMLDASELCREVVFSFEQQALLKKQLLRFDDSGGAVTLCADREKLEIILFNLLSNAIKFTPAGGQINVSLQETSTEVIIEVADSGRGIPPEMEDKLFNRFFQVKEAGQAPQTGFGIGLYLVKHFATLHHGTIAYHSEQGQGATFRLALLKGDAHFKGQEVQLAQQSSTAVWDELAGSVESMEADQAQDLGSLVAEKPTILVVDDDEELRQYVSMAFSDAFNVLQAENGAVGLKMAAQLLPDLIISDITMEELGGLELCRQVKENSALSHIPIILLTASTASETRLEGLKAGADDYVTKPFEKELLKARVANLLKKRNSLQQYFYNEVTLQQTDGKISAEYKEFLEKCIHIIEEHLDDENFSIKTLTAKMGMSRSSLYRKVNSVSGQSIVGFIRVIRLRKAAQLMITTEYNVTEIAGVTGFNDIKYFRTHFTQLFGMKPLEYIRKYRKPFHNNIQLNRDMMKPD
ncbi:two-component regulator propeller domain-containing protein [uncultured Chitinophaga sp.]|uniref:hybrid sensor histidine kinase/response regulator transcription factor n=1 Tax=uncultured Chitinophaga sp. TaxID=339340 RepID=UPI0025DE09D2|nr:two-component regulator propeller domain-containing protein [uncultured Chitinophaga sp.]